MNKPELSPYDHDLIHMVRNLVSHVDVSQHKENPENYVLHWSLDKEDDQLREAVLNAIMGRLGSRYVETVGTRVNATIIKYDTELWPEQIRYEMLEPNDKFGSEFIRTLIAKQFTNENIGLLANFVGGGTHTIPKTDDHATFEFPDQDGMNLLVKENDYVVLENGVFSVIDQKTFEKFYTRNL